MAGSSHKTGSRALGATSMWPSTDSKFPVNDARFVMLVLVARVVGTDVGAVGSTRGQSRTDLSDRA